MASSPGTFRFPEVAAKPSAPPSGYALIYIKTDNVLYLQDSSGTEIALGSASSITSLTGEATATGPGAAVVTLSNSAVIGKVLTGFTPGPNSPVNSADTILQAFQKLQAQVTASSGSAITQLTGDVSATGPGSVSATVNSVGGSSAADIHSAELAANAATASNTSSTIVERDASGNFAANVITASLNGNATTATTATNFSGSLSGDVTGTQTSTVVAMVGGKTASDVAQSVTDTQAATSVNTPSTIVKRDSSGNFAAGTITATLTGSASANVLKSGDTMTGPLDITASNIAALAVSSTLTVDTVNNRVGINQLTPTEALDVVGNGKFTGTVTASNISGSNTGDVTVLDTDSIDLSLTGQQISADLKLSSDAADAGNVKATTTIHSGAGAGLHVELPFGTPVQIGTSNFVGAASSFALSDHVHSHGNQTSPTLHAVATTLANGFMSSTDKTKLDNADFSGTAAKVQSLEVNGTAGAGYIQLDGQSSTPSNPPATDVRLYTNTVNGFNRTRILASDGSIFAINRDLFYICYNNTGSTINKGQVVYVNGTNTNVPQVALAQANSPSTAPAFGLAYDTVATGNFLRVQISGSVSGFDTSALTAGVPVYLSSSVAGGFTTTEPIAPNVSQVIGYVTNSAVSGSIDLSIRAGLNTSSGSYRSSFQVGPATGSSEIDVVFANAFAATLAWNPTATFKLLLPPTQGTAGTYLANDGTGNLSWTNPLVNIDGGTAASIYVSGQIVNGGTP